MAELTSFQPGLESPGRQSVAITLHDTNALPWEPRYLWIGTGGTLVYRLRDDAADRTLTNIPDGFLLPGIFKLLKATGSTVAGVVAFR